MSDDLITRLKALTSPCREVDEAICDALFTERQRTCIKGLSDADGGMNMWRYPNGHIANALRFTGSIDAAMTLVSEGWNWRVEYQHGGRCISYVWPSIPEAMAGDAATPAIALCIAALKARKEI